MTVPATPGDLLILVTDGLMDAANASGDRFGVDRLEALFERYRAERPERLCRCTMDAIRAFRGAAAQEDDMTILAMEI